MHRRAIESIAEEEHRAIDHVKSIYDAELKHLKVMARIKDFLPTSVQHRARSALRRPIVTYAERLVARCDRAARPHAADGA